MQRRESLVNDLVITNEVSRKRDQQPKGSKQIYGIKKDSYHWTILTWRLERPATIQDLW